MADAAYYSGFSGICTPGPGPYAHMKKLSDEESAFNFYLSQLHIKVARDSDSECVQNSLSPV